VKILPLLDPPSLFAMLSNNRNVMTQSEVTNILRYVLDLPDNQLELMVQNHWGEIDINGDNEIDKNEFITLFHSILGAQIRADFLSEHSTTLPRTRWSILNCCRRSRDEAESLMIAVRQNGGVSSNIFIDEGIIGNLLLEHRRYQRFHSFIHQGNFLERLLIRDDATQQMLVRMRAQNDRTYNIARSLDVTAQTGQIVISEWRNGNWKPMVFISIAVPASWLFLKWVYQLMRIDICGMSECTAQQEAELWNRMTTIFRFLLELIGMIVKALASSSRN